MKGRIVLAAWGLVCSGILAGCGPAEEDRRPSGPEAKALEFVRNTIEEAVASPPANETETGSEIPVPAIDGLGGAETAALPSPFDAEAPAGGGAEVPSPFAAETSEDAPAAPSPFAPETSGDAPGAPAPFGARSEATEELAATPQFGADGSMVTDDASAPPAGVSASALSAFGVSVTTESASASPADPLGAGPGYTLEVQPPTLPEWGYKGERGPQSWAGLAPVCAPCGEGLEQSPIDLKSVEGTDLANPVFHYGLTPIKIENTGHTVQVNVGPGHWIELDGQRYDLIQFHFHTPSEHAINGEHLEGEMHLVHRNGEGEIAVVAVFMNKGRKNEAYAEMLEYLPSEAGLALDFGDEASIMALLPPIHTAYRYEGSLTTPPCTEGVNWVVLTEPVSLSVGQITPIAEVLGANVRPLQPLNERSVELDLTP